MSFKPEGYTEITPYLTVKDAHKLLHFVVSVFDAQAIRKVEELDGTLKHAAVKIGDAVLEMSEATEQWEPHPAALHTYVEDVETTLKKAVDAGCTVLMEPQDMDYGERSSAVLDPFGNKWYIATFTRSVTTCGERSGLTKADSSDR